MTLALVAWLALFIWLRAIIVNKSSKIAAAFKRVVAAALKWKPVLKKPIWVPEAPEGSVPRTGSRRWARAVFYNGLCTIEELSAFYTTHPEDLTDPDR